MLIIPHFFTIFYKFMAKNKILSVYKKRDNYKKLDLIYFNEIKASF